MFMCVCVYVGWKIQPEHSGGGLFMEYGSHLIDTLDFLLGSLQHVYGDAVNISPPYTRTHTYTHTHTNTHTDKKESTAAKSAKKGTLIPHILVDTAVTFVFRTSVCVCVCVCACVCVLCSLRVCEHAWVLVSMCVGVFVYW